MRTRTDVSGRPSGRSMIVLVRASDPAIPAASRSVLAARLTASSPGAEGSCKDSRKALCRRSCGSAERSGPLRSRPEANCAAQNDNDTAIAPKMTFEEIALEIPLDSSGMPRPPIDPSPHGDRRLNASSTPQFPIANDHLTVCEKKYRHGGNDSGGLCVIPAAGYPPAPLTGDVGRGCGDASRALLFSVNTAKMT